MSIDVSKTLAPRRGKASTMVTSEIVLAAGEIFVEYPNTGIGTTGTYKIKFGNGTSQYKDLPYAFDNVISSSIVVFDEDSSTTPSGAISHVVSGSQLNTIIAGLKKAISLEDSIFNNHDADTDIHVSKSDREQWDDAYTHSQSVHAPSDAEKNIIVGIKVNGTTITPDSDRVVNIIDENTTYSYGVNGNNKPDGQVQMVLTDSNSQPAGTITIKGGDNTSVITDTNGNIVVNAVDTVYTHPDSGVIAGTYSSVTVNAQGHVTAGSTGSNYPVPITAEEAIDAKSLIGRGTTGYVEIVADNIIDIRYPIVYSPNAMAAAANTTNTFIIGNFDITGSISTKLTTGAILYAKGTVNGVLFTIESLTHSEPTSDDGYEYLMLGIASSIDSLFVTPDHSIYKYSNGIFGKYSDNGDYGTEDPMSTI